MALGLVADINLALTATLTGGNCAADLPLTNLALDRRFKGAPTRFLAVETLANSTFYVALSKVRTVRLISLMFTTLSISARWRVSGIGAGGSWLAPSFVSPWTAVYGAVYSSYDMQFEDDNWFTGQVSTDEINLFARHAFMVIDPEVVSDLRIEIDDTTNALGWFDVGGLFVAGAFSPAVNYERGHDLRLDSRDVTDEAPSGRIFTESRTGRRAVSVSYEMLSTVEARRWFDAGVRAQGGKTVIFIPDVDDEPGRIREAFPANFEKPPNPRFYYPNKNPLTATFREILA